jgi:hypothetical protein
MQCSVPTRNGALLALLAALLLTSGCAILSPPPPRTGGNTIGDAAREAKRKKEEPREKDDGQKKEEKHRRLVAGEREEPPPAVVVEVETQEDLEPEFESAPPRHDQARHVETPWRLGFVAGSGSVEGRTFEGTSLAGLVVCGTPTPRTRVDLALLATSARFTPESGFDGALVNPIELAADLSFRYQLTPGHTAMGIYPIAGMRFGTLFWDYRTPILLEEDGTTRRVGDDWINYFAPYAGIGIGILRTRHLEMGINFTGGVRFYDGHTQEGLRNDRFDTAGFGQVIAETTVRF